MDLYIKVAQVAFPLLSITVIIVGWQAQRKSDKLKIVQTQLSQMKSEAYAGVYSFFFDLIKDSKKNRVNHNEATKKLFKIKETILSYGSDDVIQNLSIWLQNSNDQENTYQRFQELGQLLLSIRKDMGYPHTKLSEEDLLLYIMQDKNELSKLQEYPHLTDRI